MAGFWENLKKLAAGEELTALEKEIVALRRQLEGAETLKREAIGAAEAWQYEAEKAKEAYAKESQERWRLSQECDEWERKCAVLKQEKEELAQKCSQLEEQLKVQAEKIRQGVEAEAGELGVGQAEEAEETEEERRMRELMRMEICECCFPARVERTLTLFFGRLNVTLDELCSHRMSELLGARHFGEVSANKLNYRLREMGLSLAVENSEMMQAKIDKILRPSQACFVKLADLDLSEQTYNELASKGYETVADVIVCHNSVMIWSKNQVREEFTSKRCANEFLKKIAAFGFVLD